MRGILWLLALAGCFHRIDAAMGDAPDGTVDAPCYGHLGVQVCQAFTGTVTVPTPLDTDVSTTCSLVLPPNGTGRSLCVFAAGSLVVNGVVTAHGSRPLVLFASDQIAIESGAVLDVASHLANSPGPGAGDSGCTGIGFANVSGIGGSGGPGGSFGTLGGAGGGGAKSGAVSPGAPPGGTDTVSYIHGGCAGATGQQSDKASSGTGGDGGGGVYLLAGTGITVYGAINASGAPGAGASSSDGGAGGGGSGGLIVLDASILTINNGVLVASGGGGGGSNPTGTGFPGTEPNIAVPTTPAAGGLGASVANGTGGSGSTTMTGTAGRPGQMSTSFIAGGGGGGGGAGRILVYGQRNLTNAKIVPMEIAGP